MVTLTRFNRESISSLNGTQTNNFYETLRQMHSSYSLTIININNNPIGHFIIKYA